MLDTHSLESISNKVSLELKKTIVTRQRIPVLDLDLDKTLKLSRTFDIDRPVRYQTVSVDEDRKSKLIGILFCHPKSPIGKDEIVDHLDYFHERSGEVIDLFCVGFGASWPHGHCSDQTVVTNVDGIDWLFSAKAFNAVRNEVERQTKWQYSGETDLILLAARKDDEQKSFFDFSCAIACNLEVMKSDKAFTSVRAFFEEIFKFGEKYKGPDPVWVLSDKKGFKEGANFLRSAILSILPKQLRESYEKAKHFVVQDISK